MGRANWGREVRLGLLLELFHLEACLYHFNLVKIIFITDDLCILYTLLVDFHLICVCGLLALWYRLLDLGLFLCSTIEYKVLGDHHGLLWCYLHVTHVAQDLLIGLDLHHQSLSLRFLALDDFVGIVE